MDNLTVTNAEHKFCMYQRGVAGSFMDLLIKTMLHADQGNMAKLRLAFPDLVDVVDKFQNEAGYWQGLEKRWNNGSGISILPAPLPQPDSDKEDAIKALELFNSDYYSGKKWDGGKAPYSMKIQIRPETINILLDTLEKLKQ